MNYFRKIVRLIKDIRNFRYFIYHLCHYLNLFVPLKIALRISRLNKIDQEKQGIRDVYIPTLDGSDQVVHPDFDRYKNKLVYVCTPYPYGMEEYENPCLYMGDDIFNMHPVLCPVDTQSTHKQGVHLSDPCVAVAQNQIICIYRDTKYLEDTIYLKRLSVDDSGVINNQDRHMLLQRKDCLLLSPALMINHDDLWLYYVLTDKKCSSLYLNIYSNSDLSLVSTHSITVLNEPNNYILWHIGISTADDFTKSILNNKLAGLFLYTNQNDNNDFRLFIAENDCNDFQVWSIVKEVQIPDDIMKVVWFPYKSCFNPLNNKILLSFRDYKKRNRLVEIDQ